MSKKVGRVLYIFFTHFPPETPFLKAPGRCPSSLSPFLSHRGDSHTVCGDLHSPAQSDNQPSSPFHIFTLLFV